MFPMQITLNVTNADQLNALAAISGGVKIAEATSPRTAKVEAKAETAKKPDAATAPADTRTTAEPSVAQEKKAESSDSVSVMSVDERAAVIKNLAGGGKRDEVVALLAKYGAKKGSEVKAEDLPAFDAELKAL